MTWHLAPPDGQSDAAAATPPPDRALGARRAGALDGAGRAAAVATPLTHPQKFFGSGGQGGGSLVRFLWRLVGR